MGLARGTLWKCDLQIGGGKCKANWLCRRGLSLYVWKFTCFDISQAGMKFTYYSTGIAPENESVPSILLCDIVVVTGGGSDVGGEAVVVAVVADGDCVLRRRKEGWKERTKEKT